MWYGFVCFVFLDYFVVISIEGIDLEGVMYWFDFWWLFVGVDDCLCGVEFFFVGVGVESDGCY